MASVIRDPPEDFWRDRSHKTSHIPNLPRDFQLRSDNVSVSLDYARKWEVTSSLRDLMKDSAERADNVGIDEVDSERQQFFEEFSEVFVARGSTDKTKVAAFIVIGPSLNAADHLDSCLAEVQVIRSRDVSDATYCDLVELAFELAKQLDIGYTICSTSIAAHCHDIIRLLREKSGFQVLLEIPLSVNIGRGIGLTDNVLMSRNIQPAGYVRQPRSTDELLALLSRHGIVDGPDDDKAYFETPLPVVSFPQTYLDVGNSRLYLRDAKHSDDRPMYDLLKSTTQRGEGYSLSQFPNLAAFRRFRLKSRTYISVLEDASSGEIVGTLMVGPSLFARSESAKFSMTSAILSKEVQNSGIMKKVVQRIDAIVTQLGYDVLIGFYFSDNVRSRRLIGKNQSQTLGVIPSSGYVVGSGWTNAVVAYKRMNTKEQPKAIEARL